MSRVVVLGPQQELQTVGRTVTDLGLLGSIATITAGWQEWESDDSALSDQLGGRDVNLRLYARADAVWEADPDPRAGHRTMQDRLRQLRGLYNRRLAHMADDWMELLTASGPADLLDPERAQALAAVQALDAHHLDRIADVRADFESTFSPLERPAVARERAEIQRHLRGCAGVVIEGGHVALLRNRLALFGIGDLLADKPVIACSGGAMVLGERVVLFHDSPPSGPGHTEVALPGLGLYRGLVPLPHARTRLRLDDATRVARMVARFAPDPCVVLGPGTRLDWDGAAWSPFDVERLSEDGSVRRWEAAA